MNLATAVNLWPTPRANDAEKRGAIANDPRNGLPAAALWREKGEKRERGQLNPPFVEWLMGWPIGWTDLKPLAMDKYREWEAYEQWRALNVQGMARHLEASGALD